MVDHTRTLQPENTALSLQVLRKFSTVMKRYGVRHVKAVATSALREAENADMFIRRVREETGIRVEVISGEKEAHLILKGILYAFSPAGVKAMRPLSPALAGESAKESPPQALLSWTSEGAAQNGLFMMEKIATVWQSSSRSNKACPEMHQNGSGLRNRYRRIKS